VLLIILTVPTLLLTFQLADTKAIDTVNEDNQREALVIKVRANLFWWEFEYPDLGIVTSQELVVPTDERVYFQLTASDVKHSFWIPAAGGKMDSNVDGTNEFYLEFDRAASDRAGNVFFGKCAEFCGSSHALMNFRVRAVSRGEFNAWAVNIKKDNPTTLTADAEAGREIFNQNCIGCHAISVDSPGGISVGPNLDGFGDRLLVAGIMDNTTENVTNWIKNPEQYKQGNKMSGSYSLTDAQIDQVVQYIESLHVK
jgi:cytochrome c oxidase subunit 2